MPNERRHRAPCDQTNPRPVISRGVTYTIPETLHKTTNRAHTVLVQCTVVVIPSLRDLATRNQIHLVRRIAPAQPPLVECPRARRIDSIDRLTGLIGLKLSYWLVEIIPGQSHGDDGKRANRRPQTP